MPFDLINDLFIFPPMIDAVLKENGFAEAYLNKVVVHLKKTSKHKSYLNYVFIVINLHRMKLKISKCEISKEEVKLFGHTVSPDNLEVE